MEVRPSLSNWSQTHNKCGHVGQWRQRCGDAQTTAYRVLKPVACSSAVAPMPRSQKKTVSQQEISKSKKKIKAEIDEGESRLTKKTITNLLFKNVKKPWLVWLSRLRASLWTKGSLVRIPVRAHAWVVGQVPSGGCMKGNHTLMFPSSSFSLPKNK